MILVYEWHQLVSSEHEKIRNQNNTNLRLAMAEDIKQPKYRSAEECAGAADMAVHFSAICILGLNRRYPKK